MKIIIDPISQRGKNRVKEHGNIMKLQAAKYIDGIPAVLVESLECTFGEEKWLGWLTEKEIVIPDHVKEMMKND